MMSIGNMSKSAVERMKIEAQINALYKIRNKRPLDEFERQKLTMLEERLHQIDRDCRVDLECEGPTDVTRDLDGCEGW